jgi:hypothetical protein
VIAGPVVWASKRNESLNLLADEETDDGKHGNTPVGKFSLAVTREGGLIDGFLFDV